MRSSDWSSDVCSSDLDGEILVGQRVAGFSTGTRLNSKRNERIAAFMVDDLRDDDKGVVIAAWPFSDDPYTRAERLDVYSGRRVVVARAPVQNAEFVTDRSEEHTSELQSLMRNSYDVFCLKKKKQIHNHQ